MKYSVIVPVYNSECTLERCVESILGQKSSSVEIEVLLIDNDSTDGSLAVARNLECIYDEIIVLQCKEKGVSSTRNVGLQNASGDIIAFCDADDYWDYQMLLKVESEFQNPSIGIVCVGFISYDEDNARKNLRISKKHMVLKGEKAIEAVIFENHVMGSVCNKFYRRNVIRNHFFNEQITHCEDMLFNVEILSENQTLNFLILDYAGYYYVQHKNSATHDYSVIYDSHGYNKYISLFNLMIDSCSMSQGLQDKVMAKKAQFAISDLKKNAENNIKLTDRQCELLRQELKANFGKAIICRNFSFKMKLKWLLWMIRYHFFVRLIC